MITNRLKRNLILFYELEYSLTLVYKKNLSIDFSSLLALLPCHKNSTFAKPLRIITEFKKILFEYATRLQILSSFSVNGSVHA